MAASTVYSGGEIQITAPTGNEKITADTGGSPNAWMTSAQIAALSAIKAMFYNTSALAVAGQLTVANVTGGSDTVYLAMTGAFAGAAAIQLPTAAAILAAQPMPVGATYNLRVINPSGQTLTLTTAAGITLSGAVSIPTETFRDYLVTVTSPTTLTVQDVGSGTAVAE